MFFYQQLAPALATSFLMTQSIAQSMPAPLTGEYYLRGVREVGSGIKLNADSTFEFFFAYGALDRAGSGTWTLQGDQLVLNSRPRPPKDFALVTSRTVPGNKLTIRIVDPNVQLLRYVECAVKNGPDVSRQTTNEKGEAYFAKQPIDAISVLFRLCPDRYSVFDIPNKAHNYFAFRFEPWISEVFFENVAYTISGSDLNGPHPLLEPGKTYSFERH
ncbi:hypothetical protein [Spirosoma koreense]